MEENQQEMMYKLSMFEQHIRQLQQQIQAVEQGMMDLDSLNLGLNDLIGKTDKEIMAPIGKGIFAKAKLISEDLIVDIGNRTLVKKSIPETQKLLQEQLEKLGEIRNELEESLEEVGSELEATYMKAQEEEGSRK